MTPDLDLALDANRSWPADRPLRRRYHVTRALMHARYPKAFPARGQPAAPLKVGIRQDLIAVRKELGLSHGSIWTFLSQYTARLEYQLAIAECDYRIDLDGRPAGKISRAAKAVAQARIAERQARSGDS